MRPLAWKTLEDRHCAVLNRAWATGIDVSMSWCCPCHHCKRYEYPMQAPTIHVTTLTSRGTGLTLVAVGLVRLKSALTRWPAPQLQPCPIPTERGAAGTPTPSGSRVAHRVRFEFGGQRTTYS